MIKNEQRWLKTNQYETQIYQKIIKTTQKVSKWAKMSPKLSQNWPQTIQNEAEQIKASQSH